MNSKLSRDQHRALCQELGREVKLSLLFKASIHGFNAKAFHDRCDTQGPTVSVGYNSSRNVFGGYTSVPCCQSNKWVNDPKAFLFTFKGDKLNKYPTTNSKHAVYMGKSYGPYFGNDLILMKGNQAVVQTDPGNYYNFPAAQMHSYNLQLTECEVYQVKEVTELETPWRTVVWESEQRLELMNTIRAYQPLHSSVAQVRVLLVGPVSAGKSSFINSINSVFRGHVTSQAMAGCSTTSLTKQFRRYSVKFGRGGEPLPIILCDTMGLEESEGLHTEDICSILQGHVLNCYQFSLAAPLHSETHGYRKSPEVKNKIHCLAYVLDACKLSIIPDKVEAKLKTVREKANLLGIPQLALITKVDEACPLVKDDLTSVYRSTFIKKLLEEAGVHLGLPVSCVLPVKNYTEELELQMEVDVLLLSALQQMLRFADNYFDDLSDRLSDSEINEEK